MSTVSKGRERLQVVLPAPAEAPEDVESDENAFFDQDVE
jgi:hypothetical protein